MNPLSWGLLLQDLFTYRIIIPFLVSLSFCILSYSVHVFFFERSIFIVLLLSSPLSDPELGFR